MKRIALAVLLLLVCAAACAQQPAAPKWEAWQFLIGDWTADTGSFSLHPDLGGHVLVRKNHADIPAANGRPAASHDDLMVVYPEGERGARADYWDSEGHVIHYKLEAPKEPGTLVLVSEVAANAPRYRLMYAQKGADEVTVSFEVAPPGKPDEFRRYLSGTVKRKPAK